MGVIMIKNIMIGGLTLVSLHLRGIDFDDISDENILAATLILEAGGETHPHAMNAVYEVIRNRAKDRRTEREIVLQRLQFSCWNDIYARKALYAKAKKHPKFGRAVAIVRFEKETNFTRGADHYHADYVTPYWKDSLDRTVIIGSHIFYR